VTQRPLTRFQAYDASEDIGRNSSAAPTIGDVIAVRFDRRDLIKGALGVAAISATVGPFALATVAHSQAQGAAPAPRFNFKEVAAGVDQTHHVAEGYDAQVLIRWGDPILPGGQPLNPTKQSAAIQKLQFGYNNDYLGYLPMPGAENPSHHGLLVVNHEYTNADLMVSGIAGRPDLNNDFRGITADIAAIEKAAHGGSVLEVKRENDKWSVVSGSRYARRIDAETPMEITGPAAGHQRMQTKADPTGRRVLGMFNNCAGGKTPWGTWLTCEENFHGYFWGKLDTGHREALNYKRYGVPSSWYAWGKFEDRFDVVKEPNEANRFGWIVEIDPFAPASMPKKRTALGRAKHEGASGIVNRDGRYVVYSGDDERFEYVYRFVTSRRVDLANSAANRDILDDGTLSVSRYNADGSVDWLPLVHGQGPLTRANGFGSQADVLIETRRAADLLGATKMDRPEDVEANPSSNKVYVALTNNNRRKTEEISAANPRADNRFGHIVEMIPAGGDHAADKFRWEILVRCGDPSVTAVGASFSSDTSRNGWFGMPDNLALDSEGRLWVATDGNSDKGTGRSDGLWAVETEGAERGTSRLFFSCPAGAELTGPEFTPNGETLFVSVQHPGQNGEDWKSFGRTSTYDDPSTRWPDFKPDIPPRPSVLAITKRGGGKIGT
jgi:secreted PhoX family phosphatase